MANMTELVHARRSVRTFDGRTIDPADMEKLAAFMEKIENPYGIPVTFQLLDAQKQGLSSPVIMGTELYVGAKVERVPHAEEAFGYSFERFVLYAQSLGIGTVWIAGTLDRPAFERAMALGEKEMMLCVSPLGYASERMSLRENVMRKAIHADSRLPFEALFFDGSFAKPLTEQAAGKLLKPLEAVRWAPSAVNRQPWRAVADSDAVHFYLRRKKGATPSAASDIQKVDLGIALCHFALCAEENGLHVRFEIKKPSIPTDADAEYIASYFFVS